RIRRVPALGVLDRDRAAPLRRAGPGFCGGGLPRQVRKVAAPTAGRSAHICREAPGGGVCGCPLHPPFSSRSHDLGRRPRTATRRAQPYERARNCAGGGASPLHAAALVLAPRFATVARRLLRTLPAGRAEVFSCPPWSFAGHNNALYCLSCRARPRLHAIYY